MSETKDTARLIRTWTEVAIGRTMRDWWGFAKRTGLSMSQFGLLRRLAVAGECAVHDAGRHLGVTPAAASQVVDKLVLAGLVARKEDPEDRRTRRIELTAKGRALVDKANEESYRWLDELVGGLSAAQKAALLGALPGLIDVETRLPRLAWHGNGAAIKTSR